MVVCASTIRVCQAFMDSVFSQVRVKLSRVVMMVGRPSFLTGAGDEGEATGGGLELL